MQNRRSISQNSLISSKIFQSALNIAQERKSKRKTSSKEFLKKSSELLQNYKPILNKPAIYNFGDADAYFRQSLRSYNDFNFNFRGVLKPEKKNSSFGTRCGDVIKSKTKYKPKKLFNRPLPFIEEDKLSERTKQLKVEILAEKPEEEEEADVFYSPNSHLELIVEDKFLSDSTVEVSEQDSQSDLQSEEVQKSQVEEVQETLDKTAETNSENKESFQMDDEEVQNVENLVKQTENTINEIADIDNGETEDSTIDRTFLSEADDGEGAV
ncbi:hypothetical protein FQA39_LY17323 [Lamprigera yunnana]|nr:hypothetical protein FQA39_LY17323 [Lamprigera yunnana]